jgi:hypothetical protein
MAFPTSPIDGQIATVNNIRYVYASAPSSWTRLVGTKYVASASSPSNPNLGDQWYDTNTDALYEFISDGVTSYWVDVSSEGAGNISLVGDSTLQGNVILGVDSRYSIGTPAGYLQNMYANLAFANVANIGNVVTTSGVFWANGTSAIGPIYGNAQVATYLPTYTGLVTAANVSSTTLVVGGTVSVLSSAVSTSATTGAVIVTGGVGVGGNLALGASIIERVFTITDGVSVDISPANGTIQMWTLASSRTPTAATFSSGQSVTLMITAGIYSITWSSVPVIWIGGSAPGLSTSSITTLALWKSGANIYGTSLGST